MNLHNSISIAESTFSADEMIFLGLDQTVKNSIGSYEKKMVPYLNRGDKQLVFKRQMIFFFMILAP